MLDQEYIVTIFLNVDPRSVFHIISFIMFTFFSY